MSIERVVVVHFWNSANVVLYNWWFNGYSVKGNFIYRKPSLISKKRGSLNRLVKFIFRYIRVLFYDQLEHCLFHRTSNMSGIVISFRIYNCLVIRRLICFFIIFIRLIMKILILKRIGICLFKSFIIKNFSMNCLSLLYT